MKKAIIVTAYVDNIEAVKGLKDFTSCIAADGGYLNASKIGLTPDIIIGDFDSSKTPCTSKAEIISLPKEKDLTDTDLPKRLSSSRLFNKSLRVRVGSQTT